MSGPEISNLYAGIVLFSLGAGVLLNLRRFSRQVARWNPPLRPWGSLPQRSERDVRRLMVVPSGLLALAGVGLIVSALVG